MTLKLELSPSQELALNKRAKATGQKPEEYLISVAGIADEARMDKCTESPTGTAFDLFRGLTGGFAGGAANLSENTGAAFADGMAAKQSVQNL